MVKLVGDESPDYQGLLDPSIPQCAIFGVIADTVEQAGIIKGLIQPLGYAVKFGESAETQEGWVSAEKQIEPLKSLTQDCIDEINAAIAATGKECYFGGFIVYRAPKKSFLQKIFGR